jgi:hypothetical protein
MRRLDVRHVPTVVLCVTAAAVRVVVGPYIADDAFITMRYSRNLAAGDGMSYNPPDAVLGTSTPLWTWVLAAGEAARVRPQTMAVGAATLADMGSIVLILSPAAGVSIAAIVSAATIAAWPAYVQYAVSGMETSLYVLTIVAFVSALSRGQPLLAAGCASIAVLCRPDGALLVVLGGIWILLTESKAAAFRFLTVSALLCAPWAMYAAARFGSVIPASVIAKAAAPDPWILSVQNVAAYFGRGPYVVITVLALAGSVVVSRSSVPVFWRAWSAWAWTYLAAMTAANGFTHFPWYFVPLLPIYTGAAAIAVEHAASKFRPVATLLRTSGARAGVATVLAAALLSRMPRLEAHLDRMASGREELYTSIAIELTAINARCTVAATEIGTIGYHYPGRILDLAGLVSPEVIGRRVEAVLAESRARWLITYDTHFDRAVAGSDVFRQLFERRNTVQVGDARTLEVYERRDRSGCGTR